MPLISRSWRYEGSKRGSSRSIRLWSRTSSLVITPQARLRTSFRATSIEYEAGKAFSLFGHQPFRCPTYICRLEARGAQ
jgi:hypothetical protein